MHCFDHERYDDKDNQYLREEIRMALNLLYEHIDIKPTTLYPPWNKSSAALEEVAFEFGLTVSTEKVSLSTYLKSSMTTGIVNWHSWSEEICDLEAALIKSSRPLQIKVVTANIGNIDNVTPPPSQTALAEMYLFTEHNLPYPLPNLDARTQSKYIKLQPHRYLKDFDLFIFINGRVSITSPDFIKYITAAIEKKDMLFLTHYERKNVVEELNFIIDKIKEGNEYLTSRYAHQQLDKELEFYLSDTEFSQHGMFEYPLIEGAVIALWNTKKNREFLDDMWRLSLEFSNFDQCMFSYCQWKHKMNVKYIEYESKYFKVGKHK